MFLLPFVFVGMFMLSVLNPRYTATLVANTIPHNYLLERVFPPIAGFLAGPSRSLSGSGWLSLYLPPAPSALGNASVTIAVDGDTVKPLAFRDAARIPFRTISEDEDYFFAVPPKPNISESSDILDLASVATLLVLLWYGSKSLHLKFRVPQPLSNAPSVADDLVTQSSPRAFTPSASPVLAPQEEEEHSPIPAKLEFVALDGTDTAGDSSFVLNTRAAIDAIVALPTRIHPASAPVAGDVDEVLDTSARNVMPGDSGSTCEDDSSIRCTPRRRMHTYITQTAVIQDATVFNGAVPVIPSTIRHGGSDALHAFIEEVPQQETTAAEVSEVAGRRVGPQRRPRPKNPPVTVWPRVSLDARRQRTSTGHPVANNDQPRRSRTMSGM
ncbi:hypothetical protein FKP32DRAFT_1757653 [Trametes sanguinea]|nr:hypothetical protein FKP32DRAFT_1757653 [Trametes sanguinea]